MKVIIVGGVAAGASCAARLRRLNEEVEIIMIERTGFVSYANCGLPYYVGGTIKKKNVLTLQTTQSFLERFNVDARIKQEVISIDKDNKKVVVRKIENNETYEESYDKLVLCPGAKPINPAIKGSDDKRIFTIRTVEDAFRLEEFINMQNPKTALVIGGGFIGLEMVENLMDRGIKVTLVEKAPQVMTPLDEDMAQIVHGKLYEKGVDLKLNTGLTSFEIEKDSIKGMLDTKEVIDCDMAILAIGVTPDSKLAIDAKLDLGSKNTIAVNEFMQTSDENIFAAGDAVEIKNSVTNELVNIPLAGPANKQGRLIADVICGVETKYIGAQGSSILKLFEYTIGATGLNERSAKKAGIPYEIVILPAAASHATYYPNSKNMVLKVMFNKESTKVIGAQVIGEEGADKRLDVLATGIYAGLTSKDLAQMDLCYAPPFSSAKDPVNVAGNVMENIRKGLVKQWYKMDDAKKDPKAVLLDVRKIEEYNNGAFENSINIPLDELRAHLNELDKDKHYYVNCVSALRSYIACRILTQNGFECYNFAGGYRFYQMTHNIKPLEKETVMACGIAANIISEKIEDQNVTVSVDDIKRVKAFGFLHCKGTNNFNGRIITRNGKLTNDEMAVVTKAAKEFGNGEIAMTTRLTLEIQGIPYENIEGFMAAVNKGGLMTGGTGSKVRPVVSCKGTTCQYGLIDTFALSEAIHEKFFLGYNNVSLPHKFKIAVGGCPNNCVKPDLNDLGIIGQRIPKLNDKCKGCKVCFVEKVCPIDACKVDEGKLSFKDECNKCGRCVNKCPFHAVETDCNNGYKVYIGGRWGKKIAFGQVLNKVFLDENEVLDVVEKTILLFREQGKSGERFADTVARIGFDNVERQLLSNELMERKSAILGLDVKGGATC